MFHFLYYLIETVKILKISGNAIKKFKLLSRLIFATSNEHSNITDSFCLRQKEYYLVKTAKPRLKTFQHNLLITLFNVTHTFTFISGATTV